MCCANVGACSLVCVCECDTHVHMTHNHYDFVRGHELITICMVLKVTKCITFSNSSLLQTVQHAYVVIRSGNRLYIGHMQVDVYTCIHNPV